MREATGNALLTMMITSIITIIMVFFVGSLSYSKAYKVKNYIINEIEENGGWDNNLQSGIDSYLKDSGYRIFKNKCDSGYINSDSNYDYCIYKNKKNNYYQVVTFTRFEFPVIGEVVTFKIKGETKALDYFN